MKSFSSHITEETEVKPYTICDVLRDIGPGTRFIDLINNGPPKGTAAWIKDLEKVQKAFHRWFNSVGGNKKSSIDVFKKMVACPNRASWASWSGKAYRGVPQHRAQVSKHTFTGVKTIFGREWLVAKGTYKSRYEAQSWSPDLSVAERFARESVEEGVGGSAGRNIPVVMEVSLGAKDTLLNPFTIKTISRFRDTESEVIRVGNNPIDVTMYISADYLVEAIEDAHFKSNLPDSAFSRVVVAFVGAKGAEILMKTDTYKTYRRS